MVKKLARWIGMLVLLNISGAAVGGALASIGDAHGFGHALTVPEWTVVGMLVVALVYVLYKV
ncbi:hypothetical protein ACFQE1_02125 [Halobium palmae]|uniref:Uncharacterized protein n=1 Tax=Halobium palmae TaxID=1776492 RepID=A0ABD5RWA0_9EURY